MPVFYTEFIHRSRHGVNLNDGPSLYVHRNADFVSEVCEGTWQAQTIDDLAPQPGDAVLTKTRASAFHGTPLAAQLLNRGIRSVVLTGMITQGCVLHTHADALMHGFYPVVAGDGVGAYEQEWHELAMRWMARKSPVYAAQRDLRGVGRGEVVHVSGSRGRGGARHWPAPRPCCWRRAGGWKTVCTHVLLPKTGASWFASTKTGRRCRSPRS